jgi:succinyl-CoA synthetase beta subunit
MRLYEFEAKQLFEKAKIPIPQGGIAATADEAKKIAVEIGGPVAVKSQILSGGRGKAGGIKFALSADEAAKVAESMVGTTLKGMPVEKVLVEQKLDIDKELYIGVTIDRVNYKVAVIACAQGGVEIEEVAKMAPEKVHRLSLDITDEFLPHMGLGLARKLGLSGKALTQVGGIISKLYTIFLKYDAKLVEANPLVITKDGDIIAADARMSVDEDAIFRHPELTEMGIADRHEEGELTEREKQARADGIPYLDLDGNIGMFPGGAGFGIAGIDLITELGGRPANFMDSGGGPSPERLAKMLMLLQDNPRVDAIFAARFGGVSRCDDFAKGVVLFLKTGKLTKPMVMRMTGNVWQEGVRIFEEARKENPDLFKLVEFHGIETPIEEIARRAVELAEQATAD